MIEETNSGRPGRPKDIAKRDEIVAAATQLFMENGYALTSMEAVAKQAGVSKLTIYSHFADKSELFSAIIQYRCLKIGMPSSFMEEANLPVREALLKISRVAASIIFREDSIRLSRIIQAEALHHPEMVEIYYDLGPRRVKTAFADLLREFDRQRHLTISDPVRASEQFFSLLKGELFPRAQLFRGFMPDSNTLDAHVTATVDFFIAAYRPHQLIPSNIGADA